MGQNHHEVDHVSLSSVRRYRLFVPVVEYVRPVPSEQKPTSEGESGQSTYRGSYPLAPGRHYTERVRSSFAASVPLYPQQGVGIV